MIGYSCMISALASATKASDSIWRDLYMAALFETDQANISQRITQAETAIVTRARELFCVSNEIEQERRSLESALEALRALQSCMKSHTKNIGAAA
jgi:hypothetical protein